MNHHIISSTSVPSIQPLLPNTHPSTNIKTDRGREANDKIPGPSVFQNNKIVGEEMLTHTLPIDSQPKWGEATALDVRSTKRCRHKCTDPTSWLVKGSRAA